ncbi:glycosyltransferase family 9 protein [Mesorhizobium sp. BHbsci]
MAGSQLLRRFRRGAALAGYKYKVWFRRHRRQLFLRWRDGDIADQMADYRRSIEARDWSAALPKALALGSIAKSRGEVRLLDELSKALMRMGAYGPAAELKIARRHIVEGRVNGEWLGQDISDQVLLVDLMETEKQGLATAIHHASSVGRALARAARLIVLVEHRLVPLFQRTFPAADVRAVGQGNKAYGEAQAFAGVQHLTAVFETDETTIRENFIPLKPDPARVDELRARYRKDGRPLVGIAWGSSNPGKDLPPLTAWRGLISRPDLRFVSLQYGQVESDLKILTDGELARILHDGSIDQLVDMDLFAAQVAAMDAVVTISNTGAHLAGALGIPSVFILGDGFKRSWPVEGDCTPYYPSAVLVSKRERPWAAVMEDAQNHMGLLISTV